VAAAVIAGEGAFIASVVTAIACVASPIARLIAMEVVELLFVAPWHWSPVPMVRIVSVVDMAVELMGAVEPAASADEDSPIEPVRTVVTVGCAVIGSVVKIPIRARRLHSDADGDLGWHRARAAEQSNRESYARKGFHFGHGFSVLHFEVSA
jgi:hypothetical protein